MTAAPAGSPDIRRIANARMYAVSAHTESLWQQLLAHVGREAGVEYAYLPYPAPQPLEKLWSRNDLGAVFMCGFPIALQLAPVIPLAAPIPRVSWAEGAAVYRTDLIVRTDAPYQRLEDTFGGRLGWTVEHSHSGFNALRHHLLAYRSAARPTLYAQVSGHLVTARKVLDCVREGRIDIGPLDAYWHLLIARHAPQLCEGVRVLSSTDPAPMPAFVTAADTPPQIAARLREAFGNAARREWFAPLAEELLLSGFAPAERASYDMLLAWDQAARTAGYLQPA
jgi:ABC-type phosphate/phosphonate transport system substrate-binding protein